MERCSRGMALVALLFVSCSAWASATDYTVGDTNGWTLNINYSDWVSGKTFAVGDRLVFTYSAQQHNVEEVTANDYTACNSSNVISRSATGSTTFDLSAVVKRYFICGVGNHCALGMKLEVDVTAASPTPATPGTPPTPSSPPPPSGSTTPSPPSSAAGLSPAQAIAALFVAFLGTKLALF